MLITYPLHEYSVQRLTTACRVLLACSHGCVARLHRDWNVVAAFKARGRKMRIIVPLPATPPPAVRVERGLKQAGLGAEAHRLPRSGGYRQLRRACTRSSPRNQSQAGFKRACQREERDCEERLPSVA